MTVMEVAIGDHGVTIHQLAEYAEEVRLNQLKIEARASGKSIPFSHYFSILNYKHYRVTFKCYLFH